MIRLTSTTQKLQAVLAGGVAANQLHVVASYSDKTATAYNGGTKLTVTNSTTVVDIVAAPAASTIRDIDFVSVRNRDTASVTVTIRFDDNATIYEAWRFTLAVGSLLVYTHGEGWSVVGADGSSAATGGISDGDKGDVTVTASGLVWTIDNDVVTYAKLQNVSATDKLLGRSTAGAGDVEEITCTAFVRTILDDANAAAVRATIGAGTGTGDALVANTLDQFADVTQTATKTLAITESTTLAGGTHSGTNTGDQFTFGTVAVSGQSNVVADAGSDTLTLVAGSGITITTNATTDTITLTASGGGSGTSVQSIASAATITPDGDLYHKIDITALAEATTIAAPTGTPVNGQRLQIDIKDDATSRALTWNAIYSATYGITLPSATTISKRVKLGFEYNTNTSKWELMVKSLEA